MGLLAFLNGGTKKNGKYDKAEKDDSSLGNILIELGHITMVELEKAIAIQKSQSLLGSILVNMDAITEEQLEEALFEQRVRRKTARDRDVIAANSKRHHRLVGEVQDKLVSLSNKYSAVGEE